MSEVPVPRADTPESSTPIAFRKFLFPEPLSATTASASLSTKDEVPPLEISREKLLKEGINKLIHLYRLFGSNVHNEALRGFVDLYCEKTPPTSTPPASPGRNGGSTVHVDRFSCPACFGIFIDAVTIPCGHSYCRKCLTKESAGKSCRRCKYVLGHSEISRTKVNVLINSLVEKWWPAYLEASRCRAEGNSLFEQNQGELALLKYTEAIELCGDDHLSLGNRAQALLTLGRNEEALRDAEAAIRSCSLWAKGYFRKSVTLSSLGRYEEAFITLTICLQLVKVTKTNDDGSVLALKNELVKVLHKIFLQSTEGGTLLSARRHSADSNTTLFSPYTKRTNSIGRRADASRDESEEPDAQGRCQALSRSTCSDQSTARLDRIFELAEQEAKRIQNEVNEEKRGVSDQGPHSVGDGSKKNNLLRPVDKSLISVSDFECTLCYRLLYQPVTTFCGHTFCRSCLQRCLDHSSACPLCKSSLVDLLLNHNPSTTYFIEIAMTEFLPREVEHRASQHFQELEIGDSNSSREIEIPIFVCTNGFPTVPCPLHVFEPRYRLMIRRSMETGRRKFGMCSYVSEGQENYADYGTLLEIRNVQYFADGRSVIDTVGGKRFRVLSRSKKDGYNTALVEILHDRPVADPTERAKVQDIHDQVYSKATAWLQTIDPVLRQRIQIHFGSLPEPENDWMDLSDGPGWTWWLLAILPLDTKAQHAILSMNSLQKRLESISKVLSHVGSRKM